jgi:RecB family endonuclease NucS
VSQLKRYVDEIKEKHEKKVRGILVAPNITSSALKLLKEYGLEYVKISKPPTHTFEKIVTRDRRQKALKEF